MKKPALFIRFRSTHDHFGGGVYVSKLTKKCHIESMAEGSTYGVQQTYNMNDARTYKTVKTAMNFLYSMGVFEMKRWFKDKPFCFEVEVETEGQIHTVSIDTNSSNTLRQLTIVAVAPDPSSKQLTASGLVDFLLKLPGDDAVTFNGSYLNIGEKSYALRDILK